MYRAATEALKHRGLVIGLLQGMQGFAKRGKHPEPPPIVIITEAALRTLQLNLNSRMHEGLLAHAFHGQKLSFDIF